MAVDDVVQAVLGDGSAPIRISISSCTITIDGNRELSYAAMSDSYVLADIIGAYSLSGCSTLKTLLITSELGASPSTNPITDELFIETTP